MAARELNFSGMRSAPEALPAEKQKLKPVAHYTLSSLFKTLAAKHQVSVAKIRGRMKQGSEHQLSYMINGERKILTVFKLRHRKRINPWTVDECPLTAKYGASTEMLKRLNTGRCEYCGKEKGYFEVHHVRKLTDIRHGKEPWKALMIMRRRKTLVLCVECHQLLHAGKLPGWHMNRYA